MRVRYARVVNSILEGRPILIDGATGTEVERRGVPQLENAWNGGAALSHPDTVREIHEDYIRSGARIIISNTFATHRSALEDAGVADLFDAYNRRSVELACAARENLDVDHVLVAGGMSHWSWSGNKPPIAALRANAVEQASIMAEAGADLLMLEMMVEIDRMMAVLDAALESGLPVWVGLTCRLDENSKALLRDGEPLSDAVAAIRERDVPLLSIMHTDVSIVSQCLDELASSWKGGVGVYAHSGEYIDGEWVFDGVIAPDEYARYVDEWLEHGVRLVGGCCGIGPGHIEHLASCVSFDPAP